MGALGLVWVVAVAMVPDLLFGNDVWWVPVATALTLWVFCVGVLVLVVRNDRASDWYAAWKAEQPVAGSGARRPTSP